MQKFGKFWQSRDRNMQLWPWWCLLPGNWARPLLSQGKRREPRPPSRGEALTLEMVSLHEWRETEASSVIGGQHRDGTWLWDDIMCACVCVWMGIHWHRAHYFNEESFLGACVPPFFHVTVLEGEHVNGHDGPHQRRLLCALNSGALMKIFPPGKYLTAGKWKQPRKELWPSGYSFFFVYLSLRIRSGCYSAHNYTLIFSSLTKKS